MPEGAQAFFCGFVARAGGKAGRLVRQGELFEGVYKLVIDKKGNNDIVFMFPRGGARQASKRRPRAPSVFLQFGANQSTVDTNTPLAFRHDSDSPSFSCAKSVFPQTGITKRSLFSERRAFNGISATPHHAAGSPLISGRRGLITRVYERSAFLLCGSTRLGQRPYLSISHAYGSFLEDCLPLLGEGMYFSCRPRRLRDVPSP